MSCPICQKPTDRAYSPFCSKRCANVDLGRWLTGAYAVPGETSVSEEDEPQGRDTDRKLH